MNTTENILNYLSIAQEAVQNGILTDIVDGTNYEGESPYFSIRWDGGKVDTIELDENSGKIYIYESVNDPSIQSAVERPISIKEFNKYLMNPITMEESFVIEEKYQKEDGFGPYDGYQDHDDKKAYQSKLDREKYDRDNNLTESEKIITIELEDGEGNMEEMLKHIQTIGNTGHSFSMDIDPDGEKDQHRIFGWDGDGSDYIESVTVERKNEDKKDLKEGYMSLSEYKNKLENMSEEDLLALYNEEMGFDDTIEDHTKEWGFDADNIIDVLIQEVRRTGGYSGRIKDDLNDTDPRNIVESKSSCKTTTSTSKCNGKCKCKTKKINEAPLDDIVALYNKEYNHAKKMDDTEKMATLRAGLLNRFTKAGVNWQTNPTAVEILTENKIIKIARQSNNMSSYKENLRKYFELIGSKKYFSELLADGNQLGIRNIKDDEGLENEIFKRLKGPKKHDVVYYKNQAAALERHGFKKEAEKMRDKIQMAIEGTLDESVKNIFRELL